MSVYITLKKITYFKKVYYLCTQDSQPSPYGASSGLTLSKQDHPD